MKITNKHNVPLYIAAFLLHDDYDYDNRPNTFSTTTIIKPVKQIILGKRNTERTMDIIDIYKARLGSAVHTALETVWANKEYRDRVLKRLGYPEDVIRDIKVNPKKVDDNTIPIYMEERMERTLNGVRITGKNDFNGEGTLRDAKTTSVYTYIFGNKFDDYQLQLSIYRWLRPEIVSSDVGYIDYLFTDWKQSQAGQGNYPSIPTLAQEIPLLPLEETTKYLSKKIRDIKKYWDADEADIPECTPEDLWMSPDQFQYFSKPENKRATKNFGEDEAAAYAYQREQGKGIVKIIQGQAKACNYCPGKEICEQRKQLISDGLLIAED